jgi:hypothetical protein
MLKIAAFLASFSPKTQFHVSAAAGAFAMTPESVAEKKTLKGIFFRRVLLGFSFPHKPSCMPLPFLELSC